MLSSLFFFSSRRRHTRSKRDWSSDVCSSDLMPGMLEAEQRGGRDRQARRAHDEVAAVAVDQRQSERRQLAEIGRASCRERGEIAVGAGAVKKKRNRVERWT